MKKPFLNVSISDFVVYMCIFASSETNDLFVSVDRICAGVWLVFLWIDLCVNIKVCKLRYNYFKHMAWDSFKLQVNYSYVYEQKHYDTESMNFKKNVFEFVNYFKIGLGTWIFQTNWFTKINQT